MQDKTLSTTFSLTKADYPTTEFILKDDYPN